MIKKTCLIILGILMFSSITLAQTMPVPGDWNSYTYDPVVNPLISTDPSQAKPIGVGPIAEGGDTLSIHVALSEFSSQVDVYFAIYAPSIDPINIYVLKADYSLQPLSMGLVPWKENVIGPIDEYLWGDILISSLPSGTYYLYLAVTPTNYLISYYLWMTYFVISPPPSTPYYVLSVSKVGNGTVTSSDGRINCGSDCLGDYLSGTQVTLTATPDTGWEFNGWSGACSGKGSCMISMTSNKNVTANFIQQPTPFCDWFVRMGNFFW